MGNGQCRIVKRSVCVCVHLRIACKRTSRTDKIKGKKKTMKRKDVAKHTNLHYLYMCSIEYERQQYQIYYSYYFHLNTVHIFHWFSLSVENA